MKTTLLNCHSCGHQVSPQAESCPKCGQPFKKASKSSVARGVFWGLFAFFILLPIGVVMAFLFIGAFASGVDGFAKGRERAKAIEADVARQEQSAAETRRIIAETRAQEEFEKSPEGIAQREKEEAERLKIAEEQERLRLEGERAAEESRLRPFREQQAKILAYQLDRASNGYPSFQLLIGKRYLVGDGVETNLALARHWLQSAATNGEPQAETLLGQLK